MAFAEQPPAHWLEYVKRHIRADFENGLLYWNIPARGRRIAKPIGCKDANGDTKLQINKRACYGHQVLFFLYHGYWPSMVDHEDTVTSHNQIKNLRETDNSRNMMNRRRP